MCLLLEFWEFPTLSCQQQDLSNAAMLHEIKGKNLVLDQSQQVATWHPTKTGGCLFADQPLREDQTVVLTLNGSGGVELGILSQDPANLGEAVLLSSTTVPGYQFLNDVKIHRRSCSMKFGINTKTQEVTSRYGDGHYSQPMQPGRSYWLAIDVKYGEVELKLENHEDDNCHQKFSSNHGNNIQLFNDPTLAKSCQRSPAALCFYNDPVCRDMRLTVHCTPKAHQGMVPGRYYVNLWYTSSSPNQLKQSNPDLFDVSYKKQNSANIKHIEKFEKEDCTGGPISLNFTDKDLVYKASSGKVNTQTAILASGRDVWLMFELYGVEMKISDPSLDVSDNVVDSHVHVLRQSSSLCEYGSVPYDNPLDKQPRAVPVSPILAQQTESSSQDLACAGGQTNRDCEDYCNLADAIQKNWTKLIHSFVPNEFLDYMFEEHLLTFTKMEELQAECNARKVLTVLSKCHVRKKFMLMALEKTRQMHLEQWFFPEKEKE